MKVLVVHNAYQVRGGEDEVVDRETALLRSHGNDVTTWIVSNHSIRGWWSRIAAAAGVVFSIPGFFKARNVLRNVKPDIVHVHNFFPLLSPSIFLACSLARVPVVMTLHNYRIVCPTSTLSYNGKVTERSLVEGPWWAVPRKVYRDSLLSTLALAIMIFVHGKLGTWSRHVNRLIVLSPFAREKFIEAGISPGKLVVKPNFAPSFAKLGGSGRRGFLYAGRLSHEKGVHTLLAAVQGQRLDVRLAGSGPISVASGSGIAVLGRLERNELDGEMSRALAVVVPSVCYEMFPLAVIEAFSSGVPVIASRLGVLETLVEDGVTGLLFDPGNAADLRDKMEWAQANPQRMHEMGQAARAVCEQLYSAERNYELLLSIYRMAIEDRKPGYSGATS